MSRIDNFRLLLSDRIGGEPRKREFEELIRLAADARRGSYILTQSNLQQRLSEMDSRLINTILNTRGYELMGGSFDYDFTEQDRLRAVKESRFMMGSVLTRRSVRLMTDFGFGKQVSVKPNDPAAEEEFNLFWNAKRNNPVLSDRKIHKLSDELIRDGEYFFIFFVSKLNGDSIIRKIKTESVISIIRDPDDDSTPIFYKRKMKGISYLYYRDYNVPEDLVNETWERIVKEEKDAKRADWEKDDTDVFAIQVERNEYNGRGWPEFVGSYEWDRTFTNFIASVAGRAEAVATFVDEIIHKGGSRVQDRIENKFQSLTPTRGYEGNPMPPAGSPMIHNDEIVVNRRPFTTGAADTQKDKFAILSLFSAGTGIPAHWLGNPDAMQNKSVADSTELPFKQQTQRYQVFWSDIFSEIVEIVLSMKEKYANKSYPDKSSSINLETPINIGSNDIKNFSSIVSDFFEKGMLTNPEMVDFTVNQIVSILLSEMGSQYETSKQETQENDNPDLNFSLILAAEKYRDGKITLVDLLNTFGVSEIL